MQKIPTLYARNPLDRKHIDPVQFNDDCIWVFRGDGVPTRKYDGTCVMLDSYGFWWARREVKAGKEPPEMFQPVQHDDVTGKTVGWELVQNTGFFRWFCEARDAQGIGYGWIPGTYELCGPKVNGNPEKFEGHVLVRHAEAQVVEPPIGMRSPIEIVRWVGTFGWEGIVWHHIDETDGRMAKLKVRDLP